jgi:hypothetical protein
MYLITNKLKYSNRFSAEITNMPIHTAVVSWQLQRLHSLPNPYSFTHNDNLLMLFVHNWRAEDMLSFLSLSSSSSSIPVLGLVVC